MQKIRVKIEFEDGSTESIILKPKSLIAAERKFGNELPRFEGGLYAVWFQLGMPGGRDGFDSWLETVAGAQDTMEEDPTEASSDDPSPSSQRSQGSRSKA